MSKYTTEVRYICETLSGMEESGGYSSVNAAIAGSRQQIFDFTYPIFDDEYKEVLESKILKHYYTREIGFETYGLWKLKLDTKMNEIMPYYNQMYESARLEFDPLADTDLTKTNTGSGTKTDEGTLKKTGTQSDERDIADTGDILNEHEDTRTLNTTDSTHNTSRFSDTPQGGIDGMSAVDEHDMWITNATIDNGSLTKGGTIKDVGTKRDTLNTKRDDDNVRTLNLTDTRDFTIVSTDDYVEKLVGRRGFNSPNKLLKEFRENMLNIDMMVINDLADLFFGLWE